MIPATKAPSIIVMAMQMAENGYGYEDIAYRLNIAPAAAYWFVFKKPYPRQQ
jgi:orotate phosphoribosyltransferase-like protein